VDSIMTNNQYDRNLTSDRYLRKTT